MISLQLPEHNNDNTLFKKKKFMTILHTITVAIFSRGKWKVVLVAVEWAVLKL